MAEKAARKKKALPVTRRKQAEAAPAVETPHAEEGLFPLVAVGASAGGLEAFEQFFKHLPPETHAAFVVISHLDPKHSSMMTELISRFTPMAVLEATDGVAVAPDHVYVIPPNTDLSIFHGRLQLTEQEKSAGPRMPIDFFLRSLAEESGERAVVVILSGTGSDGTLGLRAVQGAGGTVFVQEPDGRQVRRDAEKRDTDGPCRLHTAGGRDLHGSSRSSSNGTGRRKDCRRTKRCPTAMQKILMVLRSKTGHDFSLYKKNTVIRRIRRRINLHNIENLAVYLRYLQEHPDEVQQLFKELLINVTSFFREPEAFEALEKHDPPRAPAR